MSTKSYLVGLITVLVTLSLQGVWAAADGSQGPVSTTSSAATSSDTSEQLQEVTVTAHRAELEKKVSKFVYQLAERQNFDEGLARWRVPVCPIVAGILPEEGEFTRKRISEIARAAGVPLADEPCRPNLLIFVTPDAKQFFSGMSMHTRLLTFNGAHPSVIDHFIRTSQPVKVWYRTYMSTPDGGFLGNSDPTDMEGPPSYSPETAYARINVIWGMRQVTVVAEQARLHGVSLGQFADYAAMAGLAQIKVGAHLDDAPTILKLFDGTPQAAPEGMSDWDRAFLKSLYATESTSKGQRSQIAHQIVHEIAP
jgi:hypothetical protein